MRYPQYRDSSVVWLGEMPEHWKNVTLRWISRRYAGGTPDRGRQEYWTDGNIPWVNSGAVNQVTITEPSAFITTEALNNSSAKWVPVGALVVALAGQGKTKGMVAMAGIRTTCNQSMAAIVPGARVCGRYLFWWLTGRYRDIRGLTGDELRDGLNLDLLGAIPCPLPDMEEQRSIVDFLDRETGRIDALMAKRERQIELLQEQRQALITHDVTKGLDPKAKMKDSGVEWLGEIPAHWDVVAYKRACTRVDVGIAEAATHAYCDEGTPIIRSTNVKAQRLDTSDLLHIEPWFAEKNRSKILHAGDLVTVRTGYPGTTAVIPKDLDGCQCFTLIMSSPKRTVHAPFFSWVMNSEAGAHYFKLEGWGTAQINISVPIVQFMPVPRPPLSEQHAIAEFLEKETARVDALLAKIESSITLLREYRTALISAAVTGKIDVRDSVVSAAGG